MRWFAGCRELVPSLFRVRRGIQRNVRRSICYRRDVVAAILLIGQITVTGKNSVIVYARLAIWNVDRL